MSEVRVCVWFQGIYTLTGPRSPVIGKNSILEERAGRASVGGAGWHYPRQLENFLGTNGNARVKVMVTLAAPQ
jgi:hypothetical protein